MEINQGTAVLKRISTNVPEFEPSKVILSFSSQHPASRAWRKKNETENGIPITELTPEILDWIKEMNPLGVEFLDFKAKQPTNYWDDYWIFDSEIENSDMGRLIQTVRMVAQEWKWQPPWISLIRPPRKIGHTLAWGIYRHPWPYEEGTSEVSESPPESPKSTSDESESSQSNDEDEAGPSQKKRRIKNPEMHFRDFHIMDMIGSVMCNRGPTISSSATEDNFCSHHCLKEGDKYKNYGSQMCRGLSTDDTPLPFALTWTERKEREANRTKNIVLVDPESKQLRPFNLVKTLELESFICENRFNLTEDQQIIPIIPKYQQHNHRCTQEFFNYGRDAYAVDKIFRDEKDIYPYKPPKKTKNMGPTPKGTKPCKRCAKNLNSCKDIDCQRCYETEIMESKVARLPSLLGVGIYGDTDSGQDDPFNLAWENRQEDALRKCFAFLAMATAWSTGMEQPRGRTIGKDISHHHWTTRAQKGDMTLLCLRNSIKTKDLEEMAQIIHKPVNETRQWREQVGEWDTMIKCWNTRSTHIVPFWVRHSPSTNDKTFREVVIIFYRQDGRQCRWFINFDGREHDREEPMVTKDGESKEDHQMQPEQNVLPININSDDIVEWRRMEKFVSNYGCKNSK